MVDLFDNILEPNMIHPLFVELQKKSPLSRVSGKNDYKINELDENVQHAEIRDIY